MSAIIILSADCDCVCITATINRISDFYHRAHSVDFVCTKMVHYFAIGNLSEYL